MNDKIIELKNLSKFYTGGQTVVVGLNDINASFCKGELVAITGESGSGKTTFGHVLGGILPYESGEMLVEGNATSHYDGTDWEIYRRDRISFISQSYGILPGNTVLGNVTSVLRFIGYTEKQAKSEAKLILEKVELWDMRTRRAAKLSSGQKQRLSIARALAKPSSVLIADEPTGNLDRENGAKIIELLAEAARDRLVILITHNYAEVEGYATRHIVIQDGRITADRELRDKYKPSETDIPKKPDGKIKPLGAYIAALQMKMHPVWCALMVFFLSLTAVAVFIFLGTFITAIDDTGTRVYSNTAFRNGDMRRIVVQRVDGGIMTEEDVRNVLSVSHVEAVERFGSLTDCSCYYREGRDYTYDVTLYMISGGLDPVYMKMNSVSFKSGAPFVQTVPALPEGETFLTEGRLPTSYFEAVINENEGAVGDTVRVFIRDLKNWAVDSYLALDVTIVGTTSRAGIFLSDDVGRQFVTKAVSNSDCFFVPCADDSVSQITEENMFRCSTNCHSIMYNKSKNFYWKYGEDNYAFYSDTPDSKTGENIVVLSYSGLTMDYGTAHDDKNSPYSGSIFIEVKDTTFKKMITKTLGTQLSVTMTDYAYTSRVIESLKSLGYIAASPYTLGSVYKDPVLVNERLNTLKICAAALAAVLLLGIILTRVLFAYQTESYRLLSNIGLTCKWAKTSVFLQIMLLTLAGGALCTAVIAVIGPRIDRLASLLNNLEWPHILLLMGVHIVVSLIGALWAAGALKKRVFPFNGRYSDIPFDDEKA